MMKLLSVVLGATMLTAGTGAALAQAKKAEVFHWWTSGGESAAVRELAKVFTAQGGQWVDTAVARAGATARPIRINRIIGGGPPAAMQLHTRTPMNDLAGSGHLRA